MLKLTGLKLNVNVNNNLLHLWLKTRNKVNITKHVILIQVCTNLNLVVIKNNWSTIRQAIQSIHLIRNCISICLAIICKEITSTDKIVISLQMLVLICINIIKHGINQVIVRLLLCTLKQI
nr:MAG TPA: hypothetical protein [Bacteriophage sp.]